MAVRVRRPKAPPVASAAPASPTAPSAPPDVQRAADALRESQQQLYQVLEAARVGSWDWHIPSGEIRWSANLEPLHGFAPGTFGGTYAAYLECIHLDDRALFNQAVERALAERSYYSAEFRIVWPDGSIHWVAGQGQVFADSSGAPQRMIGLGIDITQRKRAEEARRFMAEISRELASSLDYEQTLQTVTRLMVPTLADLCVVYEIEEGGQARRAALAHRDEVQEQDLRTLYDHPISLDGDIPIARVLRGGEGELLRNISDAMLRESLGSGEQYRSILALAPRSSILLPLRARGRTIGAIAFADTRSPVRYSEDDMPLAREAADRAALALDNARLYREAQAAIRLRDTFLSVASHELKTPLTSLFGQAQLLQRRVAREGAVGERDQRAVAVIAEQARRLNKLVSALLDVSRIEQGQLSIEREPLDLCALARRMVVEAHSTDGQREIVVEDPGEPLLIAGDALRLEQALQNLIQNAIKYSSPDEPILVRVARRGERADASVIDQGIGIPQDALPRLFQRFFRAANAEALHISGMGVGLYVVREIVALHGGEVLVESSEGRGSAFTISLPLIAPELGDQPSSGANRSTRLPSGSTTTA